MFCGFCLRFPHTHCFTRFYSGGSAYSALMHGNRRAILFYTAAARVSGVTRQHGGGGGGGGGSACTLTQPLAPRQHLMMLVGCQHLMMTLAVCQWKKYLKV